MIDLQVAVVLVDDDEGVRSVKLCTDCNGSHKVDCSECGENTKTCTNCTAAVRVIIQTPADAAVARDDLLREVYDEENAETVVGILCDDYPGRFLAYDDAPTAFRVLRALRSAPNFARAAFSRRAA